METIKVMMDRKCLYRACPTAGAQSVMSDLVTTAEALLFITYHRLSTTDVAETEIVRV